MKVIRIVLAALGCLCLATPGLRAQVPQLLNYQGRVAVGSVNFNGAGQFKFALVNPAGSTTYWSNDGSSAAGSQPTNAVPLTVSKGLYSALLGDTSLVNMTAIPASVFGNPDVRLRVWFNDGTNGFQLLTPDQRLAPSAYLADGTITSAKIASGAVGSTQLAANSVQSTKIAAGAVNGTHLAPGSLNFSHLTGPIAPGPWQVLGFDGAGLKWTAPGSGVFALNGTSAYYSGGNVGMGV